MSHDHDELFPIDLDGTPRDAVARIIDPTADRDWAELLSPTRRRALLAGAGLATVAATTAAAPASPTSRAAGAGRARVSAGGVLLPIAGPGTSPWGTATAAQPTPRPASVRPDEQALPTTPRPYTAIRSYHAHVYFDEDSYEKAALIRRWTVERFPVELGDWNLEPRGPHVTPSFYYGFTPDLLPIVVPWLQLNSLGLTILIHPNTGDPRSDHLHYALWVNRSQPVNAYAWRRFVDGGGGDVENINPNIIPTVPLET
ncbi:DOPA 4,5-dioxygenase family protein [Pseudoxanthomonas sp. Root630]|uniref:DOPA 4,5-dioxygenase family protein n=1 Tax=Pseudoxanthomonas sp. Root630 TaxID=1736574 RepID=UPI0009D734E3|nr:DOPA 4,5-dioxygenase family protein [Pseudoxanthomonas sp. Root630]